MDPNVGRAIAKGIVEMDNGHETNDVKGDTGSHNRLQPSYAFSVDKSIGLIGSFDPIFVPIVGDINENELLQENEKSRSTSSNEKIKASKDGIGRKENREKERKEIDCVFGRPYFLLEGRNQSSGTGMKQEKEGSHKGRTKDAAHTGTLSQQLGVFLVLLAGVGPSIVH